MDYNLEHLMIIGSSGDSADHFQSLYSPYNNTTCDAAAAAMPHMANMGEEDHHSSVMMSYYTQSPEHYNWPGGSHDRAQLGDDDEQAQRLLIAACVSSSSSSNNNSNSSHDHQYKMAASRRVTTSRRSARGSEIICQQQQQSASQAIWPYNDHPHGCPAAADQLAASAGFSSDLSHASLDNDLGPHSAHTNDRPRAAPFSSAPPSPINKPHLGCNSHLNHMHSDLISTNSGDCHNIIYPQDDIAQCQLLYPHGRRAKKLQKKSMQISFSRGLMMSSSTSNDEEFFIDEDDHNRDHTLSTMDVSSRYYPTVLPSDLQNISSTTTALLSDHDDYGLRAHGDNSCIDDINEILINAADGARPKRGRCPAACAKPLEDSLARHCGAERKRREKLNCRFEELRALVCPSLSVKTSKADIIGCAINLLKKQRKEMEAIKEEKRAEH